MIQSIIVALMVVAAAVYVARRYAPQRVVRKLNAWLAAILSAIGWGCAAEALNGELPAGKSCGSGCGSCGACGDDAALDSAKPVATHAVVTFHRR